MPWRAPERQSLAEQPLLSVCVPVYNEVDKIERTLGAILGQSRQVDELVVVDDASTDGTDVILQRYAREYSSVELLRNDRNLGVAATVNRAVERARGIFVHSAGAGNVLLPGALESVLALAESHPQAGVLFGPMHAIDEADAVLREVDTARWNEPIFAEPAVFLRDFLEAEGPWHSQGGSGFYRRDPFLKLGGFRCDLASWCDTFIFRALGLLHGGCYTPIPVTGFEVDDSSLSGRARRDPRISLRIAVAAFCLMKTDPFASIFPREYSDAWYSAARDQVINEYAHAGARATKDFLRVMRRLDAGTGLDRVIGYWIHRHRDKIPARIERRLSRALRSYADGELGKAGSASPRPRTS